jgi:iron-sulfur cluster assembly protein
MEGPVLVRMGVRSGGCSGMSYVMDICKEEDVTDDVSTILFNQISGLRLKLVPQDHIEDWKDEGVRCVIDPKSLLYLFGLRLDYSNELIGGGFNFQNPNAETTCGCGKSFNV